MAQIIRVYCPDCGKIDPVNVIECTDPDPAGEYKIVCSCQDCDNLFYVMRGLPDTVHNVDA